MLSLLVKFIINPTVITVVFSLPGKSVLMTLRIRLSRSRVEKIQDFLFIKFLSNLVSRHPIDLSHKVHLKSRS